MTVDVQTGTGFAGRWIVVSGASSGIGRACARLLSAEGARLILVGRNPASLETCRAELAGTAHQAVALDLADLDSIEPVLSNVLSTAGRVYGLCHAAGVVTTVPLSATTPEVIGGVMRVNCLAGIELARIVTRRPTFEPSGGSVLFVSSVYGRVGAAGQIAYAASKGAMSAAVRAMALEFAPRRIRVNSVSPGLVRTPMTEAALGRLTVEQRTAIEGRYPLGPGSAEDIARAAVFLLSPLTRWITGADLAVDGGYTAH